jgi:hypothetical protein
MDIARSIVERAAARVQRGAHRFPTRSRGRRPCGGGSGSKSTMSAAEAAAEAAQEREDFRQLFRWHRSTLSSWTSAAAPRGSRKLTAVELELELDDHRRVEADAAAGGATPAEEEEKAAVVVDDAEDEGEEPPRRSICSAEVCFYLDERLPGWQTYCREHTLLYQLDAPLRMEDVRAAPARRLTSPPPFSFE